jgi:hypothetical protein
MGLPENSRDSRIASKSDLRKFRNCSAHWQSDCYMQSVHFLFPASNADLRRLPHRALTTPEISGTQEQQGKSPRIFRKSKEALPEILGEHASTMQQRMHPHKQDVLQRSVCNNRIFKATERTRLCRLPEISGKNILGTSDRYFLRSTSCPFPANSGEVCN